MQIFSKYTAMSRESSLQTTQRQQSDNILLCALQPHTTCVPCFLNSALQISMALLAGGQVGQITLENKSNCNGLEMLDVITFFYIIILILIKMHRHYCMGGETRESLAIINLKWYLDTRFVSNKYCASRN